MTSTAKQRQDIGYMRKLIGLPDDLYKEMLSGKYKVDSSKQLSENQAKGFLKLLRDKAVEMGVFKPKKQYSFQKYKYNNLSGRDEMASPAQLRKIEAIWFEASNQTTDKGREEALGKILKRIVKVDNIRFLAQKDVEKVIKVLLVIKNQKEKKQCQQ